MIIFDSEKAKAVYDNTANGYYVSSSFEVADKEVTCDLFTSNKDKQYDIKIFLIKKSQSGLDKFITNNEGREGLGNINGMKDSLNIKNRGNYCFIIPKTFEHAFKNTKLSIEVYGNK